MISVETSRFTFTANVKRQLTSEKFFKISENESVKSSINRYIKAYLSLVRRFGKRRVNYTGK